MFKIASCILVATCISFQQEVVVAASFLNPLGSLESLGSWEPKGLLEPLGPLLDNAQNKISDTQDKISDVQDNALDKISDIQDNVRDKLSDIQDKFSGMQGKFSDILQNIIEHKDEVLQNLGNGVTKIGEKFDQQLANEVQRLKDKSEQFLKEAQDANISSCTKLYKKGRAAFAELVSMFDSCVLDKTRQAGEQIKDLVNIISDLQKSLSDQLQDVTQCFQSTSDFKSCLSKGMQSFYKLGFTVGKGVRVALQLYSIYPSLKFCCMKSVFQFAQKNLLGLLEDAGTCVQSTFKNISIGVSTN